MVDFSTEDTTGTILLSFPITQKICSHLSVQYCTKASSAETSAEDEITGRFVTIGQRGVTQRFLISRPLYKSCKLSTHCNNISFQGIIEFLEV